MSLKHHIRRYHATLAILFVLTYVTGATGIVHWWLGYAIALVILLRLLWSHNGAHHLGLKRFYPSFAGLNFGNAALHPAVNKALMLGVGLSLMAATLSGLAIDQGKTLGLTSAEIIADAYTGADSPDAKPKEVDFVSALLALTHRFLSNVALVFVGLHVSYLVIYKLPLAQFMLFMPKHLKHKPHHD